MSLRSRLLIALVALLAAGLLVAETATFLALRSYLDNQVHDQLTQAATTVEASLVQRSHDGPGGRGDHDGPGDGPGGGNGGGITTSTTGSGSGSGNGTGLVPTSVASNGSGATTPRLTITGLAPGLFAQVRTSSGTVVSQVSGSGDGQVLQPELPATLVPGSTVEVGSSTAGGPNFLVQVTRSAATGATIVTAAPLDGIEATLRGLLAIEVVVTLGVLAASTVTALAVARVGLKPLDEIGVTAAQIAAGDLSCRVARDDDRTEIGRLGHSLNTMLGQIETAFAEREASEDRLRRFVADASHELRTPLAAVQAYAELFDRGGADHPEDLPRLLGNIRKESARMAVLVEDLLLLTRLDQGRPLEQQPVDLGAIAADAVEAARAVDPERPVTLAVDGLVEVRGDRLRLRQVVDNLLTNTRVHTPAGTPVTVSVAVGGPDPVTGRTEGIIAVADHGPGLTPDQAARVFERFYRTDASRSRADGGTGLGLSIVAAIAGAHGGAVTAGDTPGGGATFTVRLPLLVELDGSTPPELDEAEAPDERGGTTVATPDDHTGRRAAAPGPESGAELVSADAQR